MPLLGTDELIHFLHFLAGVFVLTVLLMITISTVRPDTRELARRAPAQVDMQPWHHAVPA